jgi:hypothetical protein
MLVLPHEYYFWVARYCPVNDQSKKVSTGIKTGRVSCGKGSGEVSVLASEMTIVSGA